MPIVKLAEIEALNIADLNLAKLNSLEHGHDSFEHQLNSRMSPIALDARSGKPYRILDGRHRIFLARKKGMTELNIIWA